MCGFRAHPGKQFTKTYLFYLFYLGFQASGGLDVVDTYVATYTHIYIYIYINILDSHMAPYGACEVVQSTVRSCAVTPKERYVSQN